MRINTSRQARSAVVAERARHGTALLVRAFVRGAAVLLRRQSFGPKSLHDVDADRTVFPPHAIGLHGFDGKHVEIVHRHVGRHREGIGPAHLQPQRVAPGRLSLHGRAPPRPRRLRLGPPGTAGSRVHPARCVPGVPQTAGRCILTFFVQVDENLRIVSRNFIAFRV